MNENMEYEKLSVLNSVYHNTLENKSQSVNPLLNPLLDPLLNPLIKTELYAHQTALVDGMHKYKNKMLNGFMIDNKAVNGKIGIIGDRAGSGKTLSILAYVASDKVSDITYELTDNSSRYFFSHDIYNISSKVQSNLIIVPHNLYGQWRNEIDTHTTIKYVPIDTKRNLKERDLVQKIRESNFVLTTNKCYKFVEEYAKNNAIFWNNMIIDEASSIYMNTSDPHLQFQFLWLVTNNWIPLLFKKPYIKKSNLFNFKDTVYIHPELEEWLLDEITSDYKCELTSSFLKEYLPFYHKNRGCIVLRNSTEVIKSNIDLPVIIRDNYQCRSNITLNSLISYYLAKNIKINITVSKIPYLFQTLGIEFKSDVEYIKSQQVSKHALIKRKSEENECVICFDTCQYPTIMNCCYNMYCGNCLLQNTLINSKCPTCRSHVTIPMMCCLSSLSNDQIIIAKNKMEVCMDLCKNIKETCIIYSSFDNIFYQLCEELTKIGLKAERLENNIYSLIKTIKNVREGVTNIIFVSNIEMLRGMSLPFISHLIFYHEQPVYELAQILIHSVQRIGRKDPLKISYLHSEFQF